LSRVSDLRREVDAIAELAGPATARIKAVTGVATVDGACRVTVDAHGRLTNIEFGRSALTRTPADASALVLATYRTACARADEQASAALREFKEAVEAISTEPAGIATEQVGFVDAVEEDEQRFDFRKNGWG